MHRTYLLLGVERTWPFVEVRFCGRYWGKAGIGECGKRLLARYGMVLQLRYGYAQKAFYFPNCIREFVFLRPLQRLLWGSLRRALAAPADFTEKNFDDDPRAHGDVERDNIAKVGPKIPRRATAAASAAAAHTSQGIDTSMTAPPFLVPKLCTWLAPRMCEMPRTVFNRYGYRVPPAGNTILRVGTEPRSALAKNS